MKATVVKNRKDFMLHGEADHSSTWIPRDEKELTKELFNGIDPEVIIDNYEKQRGIVAKAPAKHNRVYKNVSLCPTSSDEDQQLMQKFYNNTNRYIELRRSEFWTSKGEYKIFLEYLEDLDVRKEDERLEAKVSNTEQ